MCIEMEVATIYICTLYIVSEKHDSASTVHDVDQKQYTFKGLETAMNVKYGISNL